MSCSAGWSRATQCPLREGANDRAWRRWRDSSGALREGRMIDVQVVGKDGRLRRVRKIAPLQTRRATSTSPRCASKAAAGDGLGVAAGRTAGPKSGRRSAAFFFDERRKGKIDRGLLDLGCMSSDAELYQRVRRLLVAEAELFGASAPRARLFRRDGLVASINPHAPDRSMFNWVVAEGRAPLLAAYSELALAYEHAGVRAFTVWVDPGDDETERELGLRGHVLDGRPVAMAANLDALTLPDPTDLVFEETHDAATISAINDSAYGFPPPAFRAALERIPDPRWRGYLGLRDGRAVACVMTYESSDGDCGVSAVATLPEARGGGIASRLLTVALRAAQARGARTTSLQATSKGAPVYTALGYRDLGRMSMWEHRVPAA